MNEPTLAWPAWVDGDAVERLIACGDSCDASAFTVAGKVLLAHVGTPVARRKIRAALGRLVRSPAIDALGESFEMCSASAFVLWRGPAEREDVGVDNDEATPAPLGGLRRLLESGASIDRGVAFSLMLLRHDMEALSVALAAGAVAVEAPYPASVESWRTEMRGTSAALDEEVCPFVGALRQALVSSDVPAELKAIARALPGAWWLDLVDPLFVPHRRTAAVTLPRRAAAATGGAGELATWEFEGRIVMTIKRDNAGIVRGIPRAVPPGEGALALLWQSAEAGDTIAFRKVAAGAWECELSPAALDADVMALKMGNRLWVRLRQV